MRQKLERGGRSVAQQCVNFHEGRIDGILNRLEHTHSNNARVGSTVILQNRGLGDVREGTSKMDTFHLQDGHHRLQDAIFEVSLT